MAYLYKRGNIWHIYYYDNFTQRTKSFSTKTKDYYEAKRILKDFEAKKQLKLLPNHFISANNSKKVVKFSTYIEEFLIPKSEERKKRCNKILNEWINLNGDYPIEYYSEIHLNNFIQHHQLNNNNSINHYINIIKQYFEFLRSKGIQYNFKFFKLKIKPSKINIISENDLETIFEYLKKRSFKIYSIIKIIYLFALRRSEILYITWDDIDLEKRIITIKNKKANRIDYLPIPDDAYQFLSKLDKSKPLCPYNSSKYYYLIFIEALKNLGLNYKFHDLRKTRGTRLAEQGLNPYYLMKFMRHNNFKTTMKYYINVDVNKMADAINQALFNRLQ
jgi:integrase